jgi:hypothetical protein
MVGTRCFAIDDVDSVIMANDLINVGRKYGKENYIKPGFTKQCQNAGIYLRGDAKFHN